MSQPSEADDLVDGEEAARLLEVPQSRIEAMVEEGLLTPVQQKGDTARFGRAEVLALRNLGG